MATSGDANDRSRRAGGGQFGVLVLDAPAPLRGHRHTLVAPGAALGRAGDVRLDSPSVSRAHAQIWTDDGRVWIADDGSVNGTFVNGRLLTAGAEPLDDGDQIRLGEVCATFHSGAEWTQDPTPRPGDVPGQRLSDQRTTPVAATHAGTETTRHLCAAVHLDRDYRRQVLDATVREQHRAVAPSPGVDLSVLARHALVADRRALLRDSVLAVVLLVLLAVTAAAAGSADAVDLVGRQSSDRLQGEAAQVLPVVLVLLLIAWSVVALEAGSRFATLATYLRPDGRPEALPQPRPTRTRQRLDQLVGLSSGNVVAYSAYAPFVGSGRQVETASYAVPLLAAEDEDVDEDVDGDGHQPDPFLAGELLAALAASLGALQIGDVRVDRRLYVNGFDVARVPTLLPHADRRPSPRVPATVLDELVDCPTDSVRPYLCVEVESWRGQLVVTTFVRVVVLTGILFVETAVYVLPPLRDQYLAVDELRIRTRSERIRRTVAEATATCLPALLASWVRLSSAVGARRGAAARERGFRRELSDDVWIDYGATTSLREGASGDRFDGYFMQQDAGMAVLVVKQRVADTVAQFLADHGYRTDKIEIIQNNINNGIQVNATSSNVAGIGNGATGNMSVSSPAGSAGGSR